MQGPSFPRQKRAMRGCPCHAEDAIGRIMDLHASVFVKLEGACVSLEVRSVWQGAHNLKGAAEGGVAGDEGGEGRRDAAGRLEGLPVRAVLEHGGLDIVTLVRRNLCGAAWCQLVSSQLCAKPHHQAEPLPPPGMHACTKTVQSAHAVPTCLPSYR